MATKINQTSNEFEVVYKAPFGGVNTSMFAADIPDRDFAATQAIFISKNVIKPVGMIPMSAGFVAGAGEVVLGYVPFNTGQAVPGGVMGYIVTTKGIWQVNYTLTNPAVESSYALTYTSLATYTPASVVDDSTNFSYILIDQPDTAFIPQIYWTLSPWTEIWTYDPNTAAITQLTNYCGGGKLGLLDNQLLNIGGFSAADGYTPNRISWSAPGQYGQFKPYDVGSGTGNYAAGFNDLPSTSDFPTGFATIGTVGYLFRQQGITQITPTGAGIVPFTFNHLWASELGIGGVYANSISQYGSLVAFIASNGIYTLGLSGLQEIGKDAASDIFKALNSSFPISGGRSPFSNPSVFCQIIPYGLDTPDLVYFIGISQIQSDSTISFQFFAISLTNGRVMDMGLLIAPHDTHAVDVLQLSHFNPLQEFANVAQIFASPRTRLLAAVINGVRYTQLNFYYFGQLSSFTGKVTFKMEQLGILQIPTIQKVFLLGALIDITVDGSVTVSVDGGLTTYATLAIAHGSAGAGLGVTSNLVFDAIQSLERPQLVVQTENVSFVQAWMIGIFDDMEPI